MPKAKAKPPRREEALSRERIIDAAIELLDDEGEDGLTFRALAGRLVTGSGALYWHIQNKDELLIAATDVVVDRALAEVSHDAKPRKAIHAIALGVFETIDAHPWAAAQLVRIPSPMAMLKIFERIGRQVEALGVTRRRRFTAATVLSSYIIGESRQNAINGRLSTPLPNRTEFLEQAAARWQALDANEFPFTRNVATQLQQHDDRVEFLAGIDLILTGIAASSTSSR